MYLTLAEIKAAGVSGSDTDLTRYEQYARELIEKYTCTHFDQFTATVELSGKGAQSLILPDWLATLTTVTFDGENVTTVYTFKTGGYILYCEDTVFPSGFKNIGISGTWGRYSSVPAPVKEAALELIKDAADPTRIAKNALASEKLGDYAYSKGKTPRGRTTGNDRADELLKLYAITRPGLIAPAGSDTFGRTLSEDQAGRVWVKF